MRIYWLLFCCALASADQSQQNEDWLVQSPAGTFRGTTLKSFTGKKIYSFLGIPYAEAPIGRNRFKAPIPIKQFSEVFNATQDGPSCPQPTIGYRITSEDCLHLNVYTTAALRNSSKSYEKRPVLIFIHPGAFYSLSGSSYDFGPQNLLEQDIIVVTFNYRLGALGYLSTGDSYAPGNAGMKDQVLALKWVQQNIDKFGGDPNKVTLSGYGSGAVSVSLHLVSPLSKGLFQRAIIMSGSAISHNHLPSDQKDVALKQAKIVDCPYDTVANAIECLYKKSPAELANSYSQLLEDESHGISAFSPVIEKESPENPQPFLTDDPAWLIQQGKFHSVPVIIGVSKDELGYLVIPAEEQAQAGNNELYDKWNYNWHEIAPKYFGYENGTYKSANISEEFKKLYLNGGYLKAGNYQPLANLYVDASNGYPVHRLVKLLTKYSSEPVYYYQYVHEGCDTYKTWSNGTRFGVVHNDELFILFKVGGRPSTCISDLMVFSESLDYLNNFCHLGHTAPSDSTNQYKKWEPTTEANPQYLKFGNDFNMQSGWVNEDRMNKWDELFPLSSVVSVRKNDNWLVNSPAGIFKGSLMKTYSGKNMYSFRGIPYAEAPIGEKRWKAPIPVKPFSGVFHATKDGPSCPQPEFGSRIISEDCLYLNVYTTILPETAVAIEINKPVIVFIHGGAFISTSGSSYEYGPDFIVDHDVILVTLNYRLGALGFLSTGDKKAPGNAGLKDQVLALRWVRDNIKQFGGDPNRVTLVGHGIGAWCVSLHMVSPLSKGLFHRALLSSGAATNQLDFPHDQNDNLIKQAKVLNCPYDSIDNAFACLSKKTADELSYSISGFSQLNGRPMSVWSPVIEKITPENPEPFLTAQPHEIIRDGKGNWVPVYIGVNKDEMGYLVIAAEEQAQYGSSELYDALNNNWEDLAPKYFGYESKTPKSYNVSKELKDFYMKGENLRLGHYQGLANLYADSLTGFQVHRFVNLLIEYSAEPVYYSHYLYEGCDTYKTWSNGTRFGVVHFDEMLLAFKVGGRPDHCQKDLDHIGHALSYVENFSRFGNPTPNHIRNYAAKWEPTTKENPQYLQFGEVIQMIPGFVNADRMKKWDELFPMTPATA